MGNFVAKFTNNQKFREFIRWAFVGVIATILHYGIYFLLKEFVVPDTKTWLNVAYGVGYALSFVGNFFLTAHFTFHENPTIAKGVGFGVAHSINFLLHLLFLNVFLWIFSQTTVSKELAENIAPFFVYVVVVPINFLLVRFVFKGRC